MDATSRIRKSVDLVVELRRAHQQDRSLLACVCWVKRLQNRRFASTYPDLSAQPATSQAVRFFLEELYSDSDFSVRDRQFHLIAGTIGVLFPKSVGECAAALAELHGLTESLDDRMARFVSAAVASTDSSLPDPGFSLEACLLYAGAWNSVASPDERRLQLQAVVDIGRELARFTRMPGLRSMLRMMRGAATAGGLGDLQRFLESGFDTFAHLSRNNGGAEVFIQTIEMREREVVRRLFSDRPALSAQWLYETYGQQTDA